MVKTRARNKIIATVLSLALTVTSALPLSLTAYASGGSENVSIGSMTDSSNNAVNGNKSVLKVNISAITDNTATDNLANMDYRYGTMKWQNIL